VGSIPACPIILFNIAIILALYFIGLYAKGMTEHSCASVI
jgi:hypothetical protein